MPASTRLVLSATVRALAQRPPLPNEQLNPHLAAIDIVKPAQVKFQEIVREGHATVVGRMKIPTPSGHAFILRRLDTGAISQTTMFRAAFPNASEEAERGEANWVKSTYDVAGANKSGKARFAGTWVNPDVALAIADSYHLGTVIPSLAQATPEPGATYRRSSKAQQTPTSSPASAAALPTPQQSFNTPNPAKRRREVSPAESVVSSAAPFTPVPATSPPPRRSTRLRSPAPSHVPTPLTALPPKTPKSTAALRVEPLTPAASEVILHMEDESVEVTTVSAPNMHEDIREQQELIARLKAEREAEQEAKEAAASIPTSENGEVEMVVPFTEIAGQKRARDDEEKPLVFNFQEKPAEEEVGERQIATNRRIRLLANLPPQRKSLAWGALAFAAGLGAMSFLPNLQQLLF